MDTVDPQGGAALIERLCRATNDHDLEAIVGCFAVGFHNETPVHPQRSFTGREQVRRNWTQILAAVPDVTVEVLRCSVDGDTVWTEWEHRGTRTDGSPLLMRGVMVFGVADGLASWVRFYFEPVEVASGDADTAVLRHVAPTAST
jgi:ketosteroid isomerase-like protein